MNTGTAFKRYKRRFKKKLYHFLVTLNELDFSKFRPVCYLLLIGAMLLALAKLPTKEITNTDFGQSDCGTEYSTSIRTTVSLQNETPVHVVALFLPEHVSTEDTLHLQDEALYSFYLTGEELSYLAEGAVTAIPKDKHLHLEGLSFTYHKNRLPFNRITSLTINSGEEINDTMLYHVISTEDIFALFHYISYRSIGIMTIHPKDSTGTVLSDYEQVLFTETGTPLTVGVAHSVAKVARVYATSEPSVVTIRSGFNLIDLIKEPNRVTICFCALFLAFIALLWYIFPRLNRIRLWFRIYKIRSRKRSTHTLFYGLRKRF